LNGRGDCKTVVITDAGEIVFQADMICDIVDAVAGKQQFVFAVFYEDMPGNFDAE